MQKMIEQVYPFPTGCETNRFFGALSSMHMAVHPQKPPLNIAHEFIFHVLFTVSGAGSLRLQQSLIPHELKAYEANTMLRFVPDHMDYSLQYAGYTYQKLCAQQVSKTAVMQAVKDSVDKGIPVLLKTADSIQWNVVCGYDDTEDLLMGLDAKDHYDNPVIPGYRMVHASQYLDNGYYCDTQWYETMDYVLICTPAPKNISLYAAVEKFCHSLEINLLNGFNAYIKLLQKDDSFFTDKDDSYIKKLYEYADGILGYMMECSHHVSEAFGVVWKSQIANPSINPRLQDIFSTLDAIITQTQGTVWKHWNYKPEGVDKSLLLRDAAYRQTLWNYFVRIEEDDRKTVTLLKEEALPLLDRTQVDNSI